MLPICPFDISVGVRAFVVGLSHISSFFSHKREATATTPTVNPPMKENNRLP